MALPDQLHYHIILVVPNLQGGGVIGVSFFVMGHGGRMGVGRARNEA